MGEYGNMDTIYPVSAFKYQTSKVQETGIYGLLKKCSFDRFALMNDDCVLSHGVTWSYRMQNNQNTADQLDGQRHVSNSSCSSSF